MVAQQQSGFKQYTKEQRTHGPVCRDSEETFYPGYLVVATSAMSIALARRLLVWKVIEPVAAWAMECINAAKLTMLLLPKARPVQPLLCVLLAATPPLFPAVIRSGAAPVDTAAAPRRNPRPTLGIFLFVAVILSVAGARLVVFDAVQAAVGGAPPEGVLLGALIATVVVALAPLVYCSYGHSVVRSLVPVSRLILEVPLILVQFPVSC